jgi:hypothetical protein
MCIKGSKYKNNSNSANIFSPERLIIFIQNNVVIISKRILAISGHILAISGRILAVPRHILVVPRYILAVPRRILAILKRILAVPEHILDRNKYNINKNNKNIMSTIKFKCKFEEIPVLGGFIVNSAEKDISDFNSYSPMFTIDYLAQIRAKIENCKELVKASTITKELKATTQLLYDKTYDLRSKLNALEGYLKLGADSLDIAVKDFDLKGVRFAIMRRNVEGVISNMKTVLVAVKRNLPVLESKGLKPELIIEIETQLQEINSLNDKQNDLTSKRNRLTNANTEKFNDLWESLQPILNTAKAIYSGDRVKLKDYTVAQLLKRMNATK